MNGDALRMRWIKSNAKELDAMTMYRLRRSKELMRAAGLAAREGKEYLNVRGENTLISMLTQVGVMKQRYDTQIKS